MDKKIIMGEDINMEQLQSDQDIKNDTFLKPTLLKIVLFLILSPILLISFSISSCALGFFDCDPGHTSENMMIIPFIIVLIEIVILYIISCSIVSGWNRIFSSVHLKNKRTEKIAKLLAITFILIIIYLIYKLFGKLLGIGIV